MDEIKSIFPVQINPSLSNKQIGESNLGNASDQKKVQAAKDFESVLISNMLDQNTVGSWGGEKDAASSQVDGIFWMHLAREISDQGGFGLWKDIYKNLPGNEQIQQTESSIGKE